MPERSFGRYLIVFIFALCAAHASAEVPSQAEPKSESRAENAQPDISKSAQPPIIVNVAQPHKSEEELAEEKRERENKAYLDAQLVKLTADLAQFTQWLAYATIALVAATIGLAYFAWKQARDMKESMSIARESAAAAKTAADAAVRQGRDMRDSISAANETALATQISAEAAMKSAAAARDSADALVSIETAHIIPVVTRFNAESEFVKFEDRDGGMRDAVTVHASATLHFKNFGKTPGTIIHYDAAIVRSVHSPSLDADKIANYAVFNDKIGRPTLGAGDQTGSIARQFNAEHEPGEDSRFIWMIVHIHLVDVFDNVRHRWFVWRYSSTGKYLVPYPVHYRKEDDE